MTQVHISSWRIDLWTCGARAYQPMRPQLHLRSLNGWPLMRRLQLVRPAFAHASCSCPLPPFLPAPCPVILSGANISSTYLSTRQDRYIVIRSAPQLAALLRAVVDTVGRFSYQLHPLPPASQAAEAGAEPAAADGGTAAAGGSLDKEAGSAGSRPRRRDVLLQLLQEQRLPWQQVGQLGEAPGRSWAQSLAALLGQQQEQSSQQGGSEQQVGPSQQGGSPQQQLGLAQERQQATSGAGMVNAQQQRAQQAQREHHLKRHRSQRQQRYRLEGCPAGVDPVRQAGLFSWRLHRELLPLFVAALDEGQEWQQQGNRQQQGSEQQGGSLAQRKAAAAQQGQQPAAGPDTWLVPVVQAGFGGLRQEEQLTLAALSWAAGLPEAQLPWSGLPAAPWLENNASSGNQASSGGGSSDSSSGSQGWGAAMPSWRGGIPAWRRSGGGGGGGSSALVQLASPYLNLARPLERFLSRRVRWCQHKYCCGAFCEAAHASAYLVSQVPVAVYGCSLPLAAVACLPGALTQLQLAAWRAAAFHHNHATLPQALHSQFAAPAGGQPGSGAGDSRP